MACIRSVDRQLTGLMLQRFLMLISGAVKARLALATLCAFVAMAQPASRILSQQYLTTPAAAAVNGYSVSPSALASDPYGNAVAIGSIDFNGVIVKTGPDGGALFGTTMIGAIPSAVAVDANANIYLAGSATSSFQTTAGVFQPFHFLGGFVAKLDPSGNLLWASQIAALPRALAVDASGDIYLTGSVGGQGANGIGFQPTAGAVQLTPSTAFVAKVSTDGTRLLYATYLGGSGGHDVGAAIAVSNMGQVYIAGETNSTDFPVTRNAYQDVFGGAVSSTELGPFGPPPNIKYLGGDAFLSELDLSAGALVYSTFLGGSGVDYAGGLAIDGAGNVFVTGTTNSINFPVTAGARQPIFGGSPMADSRAGNSFLAEFDTSGNARYVSFHGVTGSEVSAGAVLDSNGSLYFLQEQTASSNACTPPVSVIAADTSTWTIIGSVGLPGLGLRPYSLPPNQLPITLHQAELIVGASFSTLSIDPSGTVLVAGLGGGDQIEFLPAGLGPGASGWLLNRINFALEDQLGPWCVANSASYTLEPWSGGLQNPDGFSGPGQYVAPGEVVSIFGVGVGPGSSISIGGVSLEILYSSTNQVNAAVPYELPAGSSTMTIRRGAYSVTFPVVVLPVFPGIFTVDGDIVAATNQDGTVNSPLHPAPPGSALTVFATGLGPVDSNGVPVISFSGPQQGGTTWPILSVAHPASLPDGVFAVTAKAPSLQLPGYNYTAAFFYLTYGSPWSQSTLHLTVWVQFDN